ncbi:MAG: proton-conducting transporter membrane subunit [Elusimicrobiota bacterium]
MSVLGFIILPLIVAGILPLLGKLSKKILPDFLSNITLLVLAGYCFNFVWEVVSGKSYVNQLNWFGLPVGITLRLDALSLLLLFTISIVSLGVTLFSIDYIELKQYGSKPTYYALILLMVAGMNGIVLSNDLFSIYVFLEIAAISSYVLVAYGLGQEELEGSFKYLMLSVVATSFILLSIAIIFALTGSVDFNTVAAAVHSYKSVEIKYLIAMCSALFIMGFGLKAAMVPFHTWMPDAYTKAPATLPAMSSGILVKVAGLYALVRIFFSVFGMTPAISTILVWLGVISMVAGALLALGQNSLPRMLAYSSISQIGYIVVGFGLATPLGIIGALFHLFNHGIFKSLLFLNSGSIEMATGTRDLDKLGGLAKKMPITAGTNVIAALATAGVPPLNGFWSKLLIIIALVQMKMYIFALIAILASVITLWYFLIIQRRAFFGKLNETWAGVKEAPFWMSFSSLLLALVCIILGVAFPWFLRLWIEPAANVLISGIIK